MNKAIEIEIDAGQELAPIIRNTAFGAVLCIVAMIAIFVVTGVGQDPLQFVHPVDDYVALLTKNPAALRATIGFDDLFVALYVVLFVALSVHLAATNRKRRAFAWAAAAGFVVLGVLDYVENFHFLAMLASTISANAPPTSIEIEAQVVESLVKFHVGYVAGVFVALAIPPTTRAHRVLAHLSWFVALPVGICIAVAPREIAVALVVVRFVYFVVALTLVGVLFGRARSATGAPA